MRSILLLAPAALLAVHVSATAQTIAQNRMYALIYEVKLDAEGKPTEIVTSKVIDASSGSTNAVNVPVPESVLARVKERVMKQTFEAGKASVFGYEPFYGAGG